MTKRKQLLSYEEATDVKQQHKTPCSDCPWSRKSMRGWLAGSSPDWWLQIAHSEGTSECHTKTCEGKPLHCAGMSIYRANVLKRVHHPEQHLVLLADKEKVFATPMEFLAHHKREDNDASNG